MVDTAGSEFLLSRELPALPGIDRDQIAAALVRDVLWITRTVPDEAERENLANEIGATVLGQMHARRGKLDFSTFPEFRAYFRRAAAGHFADWVAKRSRELSDTGILGELLDTTGGDMDLREAQRVAAVAWEIVDQVLAPNHKVPLTLRLVGWKYREISDALQHQAEGTVHRRVGEAVRALREQLGKRGIDEEHVKSLWGRQAF